jgi:trehalose 6-phosphate phosphatase
VTDPELVISRSRFRAVIFDLDGVVTRTADVHAAAWKRLFDSYLGERPAREGEDLSSFDINRDYRRYVDGRPRYQGVRHFLSARHVDLPMGEPDDSPDSETICGLGNRKSQIFRELVEERGVEVNGCAVALIRQLRRGGIKTAVVSASKSCRLILDRAGLTELFDARVDGIEAERLDLNGQPEPDTFLEAARRLGVDPEQTAVLEDAIAGVTAGRRGRFGLVIGVDRDGQRRALSEHGADLVLADLCRIDVEKDGGHGEPAPRPLADMTWVSNQLADKRPVLFLDYDGTLTPIVERPENACLSADMSQTLLDAARAMPVAIVSGRDLEDVRKRVGIREIIYAGSHGFDIEGPDLRLELPAGVDALDDLDQAAEDLTKHLAPITGARLERKRFAIAVHYRQVAEENVERVESAVDFVQARFPRLRKTSGKKVFELRPDIEWDKGRAIRWLLSQLGLDSPDILPIYIGDDLTDEDAFRSLRGRGIGILVSEHPQPSAAAYQLNDTDQVAKLLRHLIDAEAGDG